MRNAIRRFLRLMIPGAVLPVEGLDVLEEYSSEYLSRKSRQVLSLFLISKREIFRKVKKVKELRGGVLRTRNSAD